MSKALIASDINDDEIDDELARFRKQKLECGNDQAEEEEANEALVK